MATRLDTRAAPPGPGLFPRVTGRTPPVAAQPPDPGRKSVISLEELGVQVAGPQHAGDAVGGQAGVPDRDDPGGPGPPVPAAAPAVRGDQDVVVQRGRARIRVLDVQAGRPAGAVEQPGDPAPAGQLAAEGFQVDGGAAGGGGRTWGRSWVSLREFEVSRVRADLRSGSTAPRAAVLSPGGGTAGDVARVPLLYVILKAEALSPRASTDLARKAIEQWT